MSLAHPTRWRFRHFNKDGLLVWASGLGELGHEGIHKYNLQQMQEVIAAQQWDPNTVTDEGEKWILEAAFRNNPEAGKGGTLTGLEIGLSTDNALAETDTYATRSELTDGNGYTAQSIAYSTSGWTAATGTPASITTPTAGTYTFSASGGAWSTVYAAIIMTVGLTTNVLIAWDNLSTGRTLADGDDLDVDFDITAEAV